MYVCLSRVFCEKKLLICDFFITFALNSAKIKQLSA